MSRIQDLLTEIRILIYFLHVNKMPAVQPTPRAGARPASRHLDTTPPPPLLPPPPPVYLILLVFENGESFPYLPFPDSPQKRSDSRFGRNLVSVELLPLSNGPAGKRHPATEVCVQGAGRRPGGILQGRQLAPLFALREFAGPPGAVLPSPAVPSHPKRGALTMVLPWARTHFRWTRDFFRPLLSADPEVADAFLAWWQLRSWRRLYLIYSRTTVVFGLGVIFTYAALSMAYFKPALHRWNTSIHAPLSKFHI